MLRNLNFIRDKLNYLLIKVCRIFVGHKTKRLFFFKVNTKRKENYKDIIYDLESQCHSKNFSD